MLRRFRLQRDRDISGVSGTGVVAIGCELWRGGWAVVKWAGAYGTWVLHLKGLASVQHIHGHDGATRIVFY